MKIGIDCRTILNPQKGEAAGIGHYNYQLVRHLLKLDKENEYVLFFDRLLKDEKISKFNQDNVSIKFFPFSQYKKFLPANYSNLLVSATIEKENLDIFHSPLCDLTPAYAGKSIVTIHDLAELKTENCFEKSECSRLQKVIPQSLDRASGIISVSKATADDVRYLFEIPESKIKVIHNGIDERFFKEVTSEVVDRVKAKLKINGKYILFLGTLESRKNILGIINAFEAMKSYDDKKFKEYKLVLAGKHGHGIKSKLARIKKSPNIKDIIVTGYIDSDDVNPLYQGAEIFLFPSFYEGFGFPALEAMAKCIPVIASNHPALVEVLSDAAILVDPKNQTELNQALINLVSDDKLQQELVDKGCERSKSFDWKKTAQETLDYYNKIFSQK